ncbi:MAG: hypothetical protein ACRC62_04630 [Microcoleus sp.]
MSKLTEGTQNFWSKIKNYLISSGLTIVIAFFAFGWQVGITLTFFLVICFLWLLSDTKEKVLRSLPDGFDYKPASLHDYPLLNFTWLEQQTQELENLEFVQLIDYTTGANPAFARCFAHPKHYCYAEVCQVFKANGESFSRQAVIFSALDRRWGLANINREVNITDGIAYGFWQDGKNIRIYHPISSLDNLLQNHLNWRQRMQADLGITLLTDISWENYVRFEEDAVAYRKQSLKKKILLLAMIEVTRFELNPKSEWLGDYAQFVAEIRK